MEYGDKYVVYMFLGDDEIALYVGITKRKAKRLTREHFTPSGHVDPICYREAKMILYCECISKEDAEARERYLIKTLNPRYNQTHNRPGVFSFNIPFDWTYMPVDKSRLDTPRIPRRRKPLSLANLAIPSFDELQLSLGVQLRIDCSPACVQGPDPALTWLDGEILGEIVNAAWAEEGSPGPFYGGPEANFACEGLSSQGWVSHTEYNPSFEEAELRMRARYAWGAHGNRVPWLTAKDNAVLDELVRFIEPWHEKTGLRRLVGTFATDLNVSVRLVNWRDDYFLNLAYLRELLQAGAEVEGRYLLLTCDLSRGLLHDWFVHQSQAVGYKVWIFGVDVRPDQTAPSTVWCNGKREEEESRWHREAFSAGRSAARRLNRTVWVYSRSEIRELQVAVDLEIKRLLEGATDVCYHGEPFAFKNYYNISRLARRAAPEPLALNGAHHEA